jgi:hypothetical protein
MKSRQPLRSSERKTRRVVMKRQIAWTISCDGNRSGKSSRTAEEVNAGMTTSAAAQACKFALSFAESVASGGVAKKVSRAAKLLSFTPPALTQGHEQPSRIWKSELDCDSADRQLHVISHVQSAKIATHSSPEMHHLICSLNGFMSRLSRTTAIPLSPPERKG